MASDKQVICHDINGKLYKVEANKLTFRPSIYGILIEKNKVLLSKQWDGYDFPGGGAELHETIDEALKREFLAEWIDVKKLGRLKFYNKLGRQGSIKIIKQALNS